MPVPQTPPRLPPANPKPPTPTLPFVPRGAPPGPSVPPPGPPPPGTVLPFPGASPPPPGPSSWELARRAREAAASAASRARTVAVNAATAARNAAGRVAASPDPFAGLRRIPPEQVTSLPQALGAQVRNRITGPLLPPAPRPAGSPPLGLGGQVSRGLGYLYWAYSIGQVGSLFLTDRTLEEHARNGLGYLTSSGPGSVVGAAAEAPFVPPPQPVSFDPPAPMAFPPRDARNMPATPASGPFNALFPPPAPGQPSLRGLLQRPGPAGNVVVPPVPALLVGQPAIGAFVGPPPTGSALGSAPFVHPPRPVAFDPPAPLAFPPRSVSPPSPAPPSVRQYPQGV